MKTLYFLFSFLFLIIDPSGVFAQGQDCSNPYIIDTIPFVRTGYTTAGFGNDYDSISTVCHDSFLQIDGEDFVFSILPDSDIHISVAITNTDSNPAMYMYRGCPNNFTSSTIAADVDSTGPLNICNVFLEAGVQYYIMIDNRFPATSIPFDISIDYATNYEPNDSCLNAIDLGDINYFSSCTPVNGSLFCSTGEDLDSVPKPLCVSNHSCTFYHPKDVWYKFTSRLQGNINILENMDSCQFMRNYVAVYTGNCDSLTLLTCGGGDTLTFSADMDSSYYLRVGIYSFEHADLNCFSYCIFSDSIIIAGVSENIHEKINVFPNPGDGKMYFTNSSVETLKNVCVFSVSGVLLANERPINNQMDISSLSPGIYFLIIETDKGKYRKIIVKTK